MITKAEARAIAAARTREHEERPEGFTPVIVDAETIETEFGWVFFYESEEFLITASFSDRLAGNAPSVVDRTDGAVSLLPTWGSITQHIADYCAEHRKRLRGQR
jgi:immunity protein 35 of polymorphic toxin system